MVIANIHDGRLLLSRYRGCVEGTLEKMNSMINRIAIIL